MAVIRSDLSVDDVVPGLVLQAAVVEESPGAGAVEDVLLEEILPGRHIAVEELSTAEVRPAIPGERNVHCCQSRTEKKRVDNSESGHLSLKRLLWSLM